MSIYFEWLHRFQHRKYPEDIRKALNAKYKSLHKHEKAIKNILKHSGYITIFNYTYRHGYIFPKDFIRIKRHRYMINKIKREIDNIKNHYNEFNK